MKMKHLVNNYYFIFATTDLSPELCADLPEETSPPPLNSTEQNSSIPQRALQDDELASNKSDGNVIAIS